MPDPYIPDHLLESLKAENSRLEREVTRLRRENRELIDRVATVVDRSVQVDKALVRAAQENFDLHLLRRN